MKPPRYVKPISTARPKPLTFYPPKSNRFVTAIVKRLVEFDLRNKAYVHQIDVDSEGLQMLRSLRGERCLLTPSHSGGFEPHVLMHLSKLLDDDFNYVAAMELFAYSRLRRWVLQRSGVYSIIRGALDRPSFSMTRKILSEGRRWLVVFPEGETIWLNGAVIPFQPGVFQLAMKAYEDALKSVEAPNMYCVPIGIKYIYLEDMHEEIDASLSGLAEAVGVREDERSAPRRDRLHRIAETVLCANETSYGVKPDPETPFNDRMKRLKEKVISRLERQFDLTPPAGQPELDRIRALLNAVDRIVQEQPSPTLYEQNLALERQRIAHELYSDIWRALRFVAIYDGYLSESTTTERFLDVLGLLELEVFKRRPVWGPRKACVQIGAPLNLKERYEEYCQDKRGVVHQVAQTLEVAVRQMLQQMDAGCESVRPIG